MNELYNDPENAIKKSNFRSQVTKGFSLLLLGAAMSFSYAQNVRGNTDPNAPAKISYDVQINAAASKIYGNTFPAAVSKKAVALSGTYTVGTGGDYATLSAAVADFNSAAITGPVTFNLTDATYPSETFPIKIEENAGSSATNTLTIKPATGVDAIISGNAAILFQINAADYVIFDGSNNGSTSQNLTLNSTAATGTTSIVWVSSTSSAGADHVTFKNLKFLGNTPATTVGHILVSGPTLGSPGTVPNNFLTIENNTFNRGQNAIFAVGLATNQDDGAVIKNNTIGSATLTEGFGFRGLAVQNAKNVLISGNKIDGVTINSSSTASGMLLGASVNNITVTANKINEVSNTSTVGWGSNGIWLNAGTGSADILLANNFVTNVHSYGYASGGSETDNGNGIVIGGLATGVKIYHNSVALTANQNAGGRPSALNILSSVTAGTLDIRNNILVNNQTQTGARYAIYSGAANTVFSNINYNDYFSTGTSIGYLGSARADLAAWQAATGKDANSLNIAPVFVSTTDLHMTSANAFLDNKGTVLADVTTDIDGTVRSTTKPDMGAHEFKASLNGTYTVGSTGDFASLTNSAGAFEYLNTTGALGNVTFNIIEDLTAETGTNPINAIAGGYSLTIKPSGAARAISGTMASNALLRTAGASNVTIDGSLSGGTDRSLSITNLSATGPQVVRFGSIGTTPMTNLTLKNTIITNGVNTSTAVVIHDNALATAGGYFNNVTIQNNAIKKAYMGVYAAAAILAGNGTINISNNDLSASGTDAITLAGVYAQGVDGAVIQNNTIGNFLPTAAYSKRGVWLATGAVNSNISGNTISNITFTGATSAISSVGIFVSSGNTGVSANSGIVIDNNNISNIASSSSTTTSGIQIFGTSTAPTSGVTISRNKITNVKNSSTLGYAAIGIFLNGFSTAANGGMKVINNFISDVAGYGWNDSTYLDNGVGITFNGASTGYKIYNNTINMNTNQTVTTGMTAAINVTSSISAAGAIDLRNNIFVNSQTTTANRYAIYSSAPATVFSNIDYNDYYSTGTNLGYLGSARATLAAWQTATGKDANSLNVSPVFVSPTDLHLDTNANNALENKGTPLAEVTIDIDGDLRSTTAPDMGADEFTSTLAVTDNMKDAIRVYPNPVVDFVNINNSSRIDSVEVYSVSGQKVAAKTLNANSG
ncbi:hypothetical protein, partial [Chryseobacterium sp. R2A-55]|uniref:hypothetical protein n=1 Tax=Chryseobacterium sp. R2A-55 TaxID=2744445 RepID=UPI001F1C8D18